MSENNHPALPNRRCTVSGDGTVNGTLYDTANDSGFKAQVLEAIRHNPRVHYK